MPEYLAYPKEADTESRGTRKGMRNKVFITNKAAGAKLRKERKLARKAALEAQEEGTEE